MGTIIQPIGELPIGSRVKLSSIGLHHFRYGNAIYNENLRGIIVGYGRKQREIRVLKDGYKTALTYASEFWEKADD